MAQPQALAFDIKAEAARFFDDSSIARDEGPTFALIMGGACTGKTTFRRQQFSTGFVVLDAVEIFLSLSRGQFIPFPDGLEVPMEMIGRLVAQRAVSERRHIVTEIIGADAQAAPELADAMRKLGYEPAIHVLTCDVEVALQRNADRDQDCISAYHAEPYHRRWLLAATRGSGEYPVA